MDAPVKPAHDDVLVLVPALRCTAEEALHRVRDTKLHRAQIVEPRKASVE